MGFFTKDTVSDALKVIRLINQDMRAISASMHRNNNAIDYKNKSFVKSHVSTIVAYANKYDKIKRNHSMYDRIELESTHVDVWNGENVTVDVWESYVYRCTAMFRYGVL
jgi:hypothetical protein